MNRNRLLIVACLFVFSSTVAAQSSDVKKPPAAVTTAADDKSAKDLEAERLLRERRAKAQSLLISLANEAGTFNDQMLRARTQAHVADLLWETDTDRARNLFRKAWDAAEAADAEGRRRMEEDARAQQAKSGSGGYSISPPPDLRKEVLGLAVKHDPRLGEEFLGKLKEPEAGVKNDRSPFHEQDPAAAQRVDAAKQLLSDGDTEKALAFGAPLLNTINRQGIEFLTALRVKKAALADERFASLLNLAAANPQSDVNTAALLSFYILTPHIYSSWRGLGALPAPQLGGGMSPPS